MKILLAPDAPPAAGAPPATAPGQPPVTTTPPPPPPPTKDQLAGIRRFAAAQMGNEIIPDKPETPEELAAREQKEKETKEKEAQAKRPKPQQKPKPQPKPAPEPITADQIAEATARAVANVMKPATEKPGPAKPDESALPERDRDRVKVLRHMEKSGGERYKGLADKYVSSQLALAAYADNWETAHPGETFDSEADEHKPFFSKHDVQWDDEDFITAAVDLRTSPKLEEREREINNKLTQLERAQKLANSSHQILAAQTPAANQFWAAAGDQFKGLLDERGQIVHAKFAELEKADPERFHILRRAATALDAEVSELYKVMNGLVDYDANNPIHVNVSKFAEEQEKALMEKPFEDQMDGAGRPFLPAAKFYKLPKAKQAEHWTLSLADLAALRASHLSSSAKQIADAEEQRHMKWAEVRGFKKGESSAPPKEPPKELEAETPDPPDAKPDSPTTVAESRTAARRPGNGIGATDGQSAFQKRFISGQS